MKKIITLLFSIFLLSSCIKEKHYCGSCDRMISITNHHATRAYVEYVCSHGDTIISTEHHSTTIKCKNGTFDIGEYVSGRKPYGYIN